MSSQFKPKPLSDQCSVVPKSGFRQVRHEVAEIPFLQQFSCEVAAGLGSSAGIEWEKVGFAARARHSMTSIPRD